MGTYSTAVRDQLLADAVLQFASQFDNKGENKLVIHHMTKEEQEKLRIFVLGLAYGMRAVGEGTQNKFTDWVMQNKLRNIMLWSHRLSDWPCNTHI